MTCIMAIETSDYNVVIAGDYLFTSALIMCNPTMFHHQWVWEIDSMDLAKWYCSGIVRLHDFTPFAS